MIAVAGGFESANFEHMLKTCRIVVSIARSGVIFETEENA
jgi:hypothetical protein